MRQSDAITALLAGIDRINGSSAAQLSARAMSFAGVRTPPSERASVPDCGWLGACRVVTDKGRKFGFQHTAASWSISGAVE
jgi:hypothetical protein